MGHPNILYIHSHNTGRYIQPHGHAIPAPNMQRLAEQGIFFRQAFCAAPTCSPSRAALETGQYPHSAGMLGLAHLGFRLNDYKQHLSHILREAGYFTALSGIQHITKEVADIGYDQVLHRGGVRANAEAIAQAAVQFLANPPKRPFFLNVGFFETHLPFPDPELREDARYRQPPAGLPDAPQTRGDAAGLRAAVRVLDANMGRVFDALDAAGLARDTLVICTTDHGLQLPGHMCNLTDRGLEVFLILRGPGGFEGGKASDAMVSHIDLFPTICDLLEIQRPAWLHGCSLMPLIHGEADEVHRQLFGEITYHAAYEPQRAVRTKRWKYIRRFDGRDRPVLANCNDCPSKELWLRGGWRERKVQEERLYDLIFDPGEAENLAYDPDYASALVDMRRRLEHWMRQTDDPCLRGHVPLPDGAIVRQSPDGISVEDPSRSSV